jgi:ABC-2 type transport system ATP-binding protein
MTPPLAEALGATRRFGDLLAVDDVDLLVRPGEVVGLLGANGAGKTTLIRMLLGLLRASGGRVRLFGSAPSRDTRRRLGYVPQGLGLYEDLTPAENLAFARAVFGEGPSAVPSGLGDAAGITIADLPLGVQRHVAFAQAMGHHPDLLVLDEPTSGVDPLASARLWETIREAADAGAGVLVTTHHMEEAEQCDRLVVMADGHVVAEGTVEDIVGRSRVVVVHTDDWARAFDAVDAAGLSAALVGRTLHVLGADEGEVCRALGDGDADARLRDAPATLEERFFELTAPAGRRSVA